MPNQADAQACLFLRSLSYWGTLALKQRRLTSISNWILIPLLVILFRFNHQRYKHAWMPFLQNYFQTRSFLVNLRTTKEKGVIGNYGQQEDIPLPFPAVIHFQTITFCSNNPAAPTSQRLFLREYTQYPNWGAVRPSGRETRVVISSMIAADFSCSSGPVPCIGL